MKLGAKWNTPKRDSTRILSISCLCEIDKNAEKKLGLKPEFLAERKGFEPLNGY